MAKYTEFKIKADTDGVDDKLEFMIKRCCSQIINSLSIEELTTIFRLDKEVREVAAVSLTDEKENFIFCRLTFPKVLTKEEAGDLYQRLGIIGTLEKIKSLQSES